MSQTAAPVTSPWRAALCDIASIVVFVAIGRASHAEGVTLGGLTATAWPFLAGLALGWVVFRVWRAPSAIVWKGLGLWAVTVVAGLLLRVLGGDGAAPGFVIVTCVVLGLLMLGWRFGARLLARRGRRRV
jgi:hypothetical protein